MKRTYLGAVFHGEAGFGIVFRDVPGCASAGDTIEEALLMGKEALEGHIAVLRDHGDPIPAPTEHRIEDVEAWLYEPDEANVEPWVGLFPVEVDLVSHGDIAVTLPRSLVRDLDEATPDARRFIIEAAWRELDRLKKTA